MKRGILIAALLLPACSAGVMRTAPPAYPPAPLTTPDPRGIAFSRPLSWHDATYVDHRTVDVAFTAGVAACGRLADVRVAESADAVTITLVYGSTPLPEGTVCPAIGFNARTRVRLPHALDGRRLVDGSTGETRALR